MTEASIRQIAAADPARNTWLSANAGSGKTRVLTDRVARLLLSGVEPQHILCLTYTKAAASEMQNRLFKRLGEWAMAPEPDLRKALLDLGEAVAFVFGNPVDDAEEAGFDEFDQAFEHLRLAGEVPVERGFRAFQLGRQGSGGDFLPLGLLEHAGQRLQNLQSSFARFCHEHRPVCVCQI